MLNITGSMKTLKGEALTAKGLCKDVIGVLNDITPDTNLTQTVGIFIHQMPEYKVLAKDAESAKKILRKVCTAEITAEEATQKFKEALAELEEILSMLEDLEVIPPNKLF